MIIKRTDGQEVEIDCEFFGDENVDNEYVKEHCFTLYGVPKCPVWRDCWVVYTRRREE